MQLLTKSLDELWNKRVMSACFLFEKLPKVTEQISDEMADLGKLSSSFVILKLMDEIMISLNEIPWKSFTLSIFKCWCDLFLFENTLHAIILVDIPSQKLVTLVSSVNIKVRRFLFRGLIHFKKMINAQKSESTVLSLKENLLIEVLGRINNCETIQDLIDSSPTADPVCKDVTFTESTEFQFRLNCNHLVCIATEFKFRLDCNHLVCIDCASQLAKVNLLVEKIYYFHYSD